MQLEETIKLLSIVTETLNHVGHSQKVTLSSVRGLPLDRFDYKYEKSNPEASQGT